MAELGVSFRRARESLGISLDEIAAETRISTRFLEAIENEDFKRLPGGIFNRGFIRTYAEHVRLDPDQAVADYERLSRISEPEPILRAIQPLRKRSQNLYPITAGSLALLIAVFYFVTRISNTSPVTASPPPPVVEALTSTPAPTPKEPDPAPEPVTTSPAPTPDRLAVDMEVHETTWLKLSTDGVAATEAVLYPGTTHRYTAQSSMDLTIGNAGGVTLKLNGQEVPKLGINGEVRVLKITPENIPEIMGK